MGGLALDLLADLTDRDSIPRLLEAVRMHWGDVDILVNNAGIGSSANPRPVVDFDDSFWSLTLELNLTVPYLLTKGVLPGMLSKKSGRIINIASINGRIASLHGAAYTASKHGLLGLTRSVAIEVIKDGITVNAICPGPVHTAMNDRRIEYDAKRRNSSFEETVNSLTPMGRRLEPEEIAPLAVYLASDAAACVTGQAINIDCGLLMF
jgi:3-hydroxybutyrate dehydrogenase